MTQFLLATVNGLTIGSVVFLVAVGLTLVFGIGGVLNFAHGATFAVGAYVMFTVLSRTGSSTSMFILASLAAILVAGLVGLIAELLIIRRMYGLRHEYMLLGTYALLLVLDGAIELVWGPNPRSTTAPQLLRGSFELPGVGINIPIFSVFIIGLALFTLIALYLWMQRTSFGRVAKAAAQDREATMALGVNVPAVMTGVFVLGSLLAGVAGAALAPNQAIFPALGHLFIVQAFAAVVMGGLGSVVGSWIAALILGLADAYWFVLLPGVPQIGVFVALILILVLRPTGLMGGKP